MQQYKFSNVAYILLALVLSFFVVTVTPVNVLSYDVFGYYLYLPMKFKYHDLTIQNYQTVEHILNTYHNSETFYQAVKWDNGNWVMRYPIGLSLFYAPFYFIADLLAPAFGYEPDGFSKPYQLSVLYGCLFYSLIGLYFLKKVLLHFFSDKISALTLICIGLGTNYFFHSALHGQGAMSHNILFSLYAVVIYLTIRWHQTLSFKHAGLLGICIGSTVLSRASEIVIVLIPLLYGITNSRTFKEKINLLWQQKGQVIALSLIVAAFGILQFCYWKYSTGKFVVNPYGAGNPGEGFELGQPHILKVLFSFRKGWFIYTPIMLFTMYGFWQLHKHNRLLFTAIFVYFIVNLYIVSSWSCWWFGSCFGNRALIPSYAALSIPLAYALQRISKSKLRSVFAVIIFLFIGLNLFQTWQIYKGILDTSNVSRAFYFSTFLQTRSPSTEQTELLLKGKFNNGVEIFTERDASTHRSSYVTVSPFETIKYPGVCDTLSKNGKQSLMLGKGAVNSFSVWVSVEDATEKAYAWAKGSAWIYPSHENTRPTFAIHMKHKGYIFKEKLYPLTDLKANTWNYVEYYYLIPDDLRSRKDRVYVYILNESETPVFIDDLKLEILEPIIDQSYF